MCQRWNNTSSLDSLQSLYAVEECSLDGQYSYEEPQTHFRNESLCRAMVDFNMIDTVSRGIKKMFNEQWRRHFPMPDYEIDQVKKKVVVRIYGNEINKRYTDLLKTNDTLFLSGIASRLIQYKKTELFMRI